MIFMNFAALNGAPASTSMGSCGSCRIEIKNVASMRQFCLTFSVLLLLLLLLLLLTAIGLSPGGSGYFTYIQNMNFVHPCCRIKIF